MPIAVSCQGCGKAYRVKDEHAGRRMRCPSCQGRIDVPGGPIEEPASGLSAPSTRTAGRTPGRKQRDYTHLSCGGSTTVDGPEFEALADPLAGMVATVCSTCQAVFPIEQFAWADTQEPISRYYDRYRSMGTPLQNFLASRVGMYALAAVPFAIGVIGFLLVRNRWCIPAGLLAAIIVIFAHTVFLGPRILQGIVGTADPRELD